MEDFVAAGIEPLKRVLERVKECDAYVGIFSWRYGFVPKRSDDEPAGSVWPQVNGAKEGITSITHYELLQAKEPMPNGGTTAACRSWRSCSTRATPGRRTRSTVLHDDPRAARQLGYSRAAK